MQSQEGHANLRGTTHPPHSLEGDYDRVRQLKDIAREEVKDAPKREVSEKSPTPATYNAAVHNSEQEREVMI